MHLTVMVWRFWLARSQAHEEGKEDLGEDDGDSSEHCLCGFIEVSKHSEGSVNFTKGKA